MTTTTTYTQVPQLESTNFDNWLFRIRIASEEKGVKEMLDAPLEKKDSETIKKDAKARSLIIQALPDKYLEYVKETMTAYDMILKLKEAFQRKSTFSSLCLKRQLISLKCKKTDNMQDHINKFEKLVKEIEAHGIQMEDKEKVCQLLLSVEEAYEPLVTALEMSNTELTIDFIKGKLLDAEIKKNNTKSNQRDKEFKEYVFQSMDIKCYNCGEPNHYARNCPKYRQQRGRGGRGGRGRGYRGQQRGHTMNKMPAANIGEYQDRQDDTISFVAIQAQAHSAESTQLYVNQEIEFVIDSGATYHMISKNYEKYMTNIEEIPIIKIQVANGNTITTNKKGKLKGTSREGLTVTIDDCLIMEKLSHNLLSVLKLNKKGLKVVFDRENTTITNGKVKVQGQSVGGLCKLTLNLNGSALICQKLDNNLWHRRMGHLNYGGMKILGLPLSNEKCSVCMEAKASRCSFSENPTPRTKSVGELIYCDIGGPVTPTSKDGERYYLTIIDDYSHFTQVHLLKTKDEAKNYIIKYIKMMKNNRNSVRRIRTDRGKEFVNEELKSIYEEYGITQETTCAYTPQQNSICERMNRTLGDKVRALLLETNLPKYLWSEAIRCAAYTINRSPTKALKGETPAKLWYGKNNLEKIRVFGSKAWSMIFPRPSKLEPRAKAMRMIGYCGSGYRLWDPKTNQIVESRDVRFDESNYKYDETEEQNTYSVIYDGEEDTKERVETTSNDEDHTQLQNDVPDLTHDEENMDSVQVPDCNQRERRVIKLPSKYQDFDMSNIAYALISEDPKTYDEAIRQEGWTEAIQKELEAHRKLQTWEESDLPKGHKAIDTKWVFRTKSDSTKKARLVAKGFQEETTHNVYAPVARMATVRLFLNKAVQEDLLIRQLDIPTAFLNGELKTNIYIKYPEGLQRKEGKVLKLRKALYGLRESPRCWNEKLNDFLTQNGFRQSRSDFCLYTAENTYILIFVDDILIFGDGNSIILKLKQQFQAKDMGNINKFLGMEITRSKNSMEIKQTAMIEKILLKFHMQDCKGSGTPMEVGLTINENEEICTEIPYRELVGSLMYLSTISRPDISYATGFLSRYMNCPTPTLWKAAKRILRYLKQTKEKGLVYKKETNNYLLGFSDSDWGSEKMDRKSVSGMAIFHRGNLISWSSKKQTSVALSTAESEYVAAALSSRDDLSRIRTCCKGYARNVYNFKICEPVCSQECTNALCTAPDTCTCFPDHVRNQAGVCVATCPIGCQNGRCDGGECLCKEGFRLDVEGRFCVPVCRDNCGGIGNCTAPNVCECNPGFQPTPDGSCRSSACGKCENGDCVSASECRCKLGYNKDNQGQCVPHCNQNCGPNGKCLAPNVCSNSPDSQRGPNNPLPPSHGTNSQNPYGPGQGNNFYYNPNQGSNYPLPPYNQYGPQQNQSNSVFPHQGSNYPQPNSANPNQGSSYPQQPNPAYPNQGSPYPQPGPYNNQGPHYPQPNPYNPDQGSHNQHPIVLRTNPNQPNQDNPSYPQYPYNQNPTNITSPNQGNSQSPYNPNQQNQSPSYYPSVHVVNITSYPLYPGNQLGPNGTVYPSNQPGQQPNQQYPDNQPNPNNHGNNQYPYNHGPNQPDNYPKQQHGYYPYGQDPYSSQYPYDQTQEISLCSEPCVNAVCIDRNRCRCNPGYVTDESDPSGNRCRPNCPGGCPNGYCAAPHTCACDEGYYKDTSVKGRAVCVRRIRRSLQELIFIIPEDDEQ